MEPSRVLQLLQRQETAPAAPQGTDAADQFLKLISNPFANQVSSYP